MDIKEAKNQAENFNNRHPWELARLVAVKFFLQTIIKGMSSSKVNLIDIGCGDLFVLDSICSSFSFNSVIGVDTAFNNENILQFDSKYKNTNISIYSNLDDIPLNEGISIILLLDVIEHISDDKTFLKNLVHCKFVNENTIFLITVPSYQCLFTNHDKYLLHFRRYSNNQLVQLVKKSGLVAEIYGYFFISLLIGRFLTKNLKTLIKSESKVINERGIANWNQGLLISNFIKWILVIDFYFGLLLGKIRIKLPGLSNYAICRKFV